MNWWSERGGGRLNILLDKGKQLKIYSQLRQGLYRVLLGVQPTSSKSRFVPTSDTVSKLSDYLQRVPDWGSKLLHTSDEGKQTCLFLDLEGHNFFINLATMVTAPTLYLAIPTVRTSWSLTASTPMSDDRRTWWYARCEEILAMKNIRTVR